MAGHAVEPQPVDGAGAASVSSFAVSTITDADLVTRVRRSVAVNTSSSNLARVVVGGGRGVGGPDKFDPLIELAGNSVARWVFRAW